MFKAEVTGEKMMLNGFPDNFRMGDDDVLNEFRQKQANFDLPETIELRRISGGNLSSSTKEISYNPLKRYYSQRPGGYDYYSQQNNDRKSN